MMYALEPRVHEPAWKFIESRLATPPQTRRRGRPRVPDKIVFRALLIRLVTGDTWEAIEFAMGHTVSDTTMRQRRDEWINNGTFTQLLAHAYNAYRQLIGFDLTNAFIDGTNFRARHGGPGTGLDPKHPGKRGWKVVWITDTNGIPVSFALEAANRNDYPLMFDLLHDLTERNQLRHIGTLHADRGFNYTTTAHLLTEHYQLTHFAAPPRNAPHHGRIKRSPLGPRWIVERTNSWFHAYGQLANNRDRNPAHRHTALSFAISLFLIHRITHPQHSPWRPTT